jgi:hypothetical protein
VSHFKVHVFDLLVNMLPHFDQRGNGFVLSLWFRVSSLSGLEKKGGFIPIDAHRVEFIGAELSPRSMLRET